MKKQETDPPPSKPETISTEGERVKMRGCVVTYSGFTPSNKNHVVIEIMGYENYFGNVIKKDCEVEMVFDPYESLSHHPHSPAGSDEERDISEVIEENQQLKTAIDKITEALKLVREIHQLLEQSGREAREQIEEILTKHGVSLTEAVYITDEIISLFTPAPSSVSNPVAWKTSLRKVIEDAVIAGQNNIDSDGNYIGQGVDASVDYIIQLHKIPDLYALFTSHPTEQGPDQEKLWDEAYTIAVNNYNDHNYVSQGVKELMKRFHITPKQ